ncbi:FadR/GntR family transcriptional regulator [Aquabacterium sp.]|jgi:DNA-binding FadR family transcriptional regulator|uniref:FadR/GntR family transcriptional regulator n=1 Tax=Aquabacterium sp. TaxID=1872578 RepID=UPI0027B8896A|nr:FadR/GntR family transcriptional regulator [Aquabacterium sp.]
MATLSPTQSLPDRLFEAITEDIRNGVYPVGGKLPIEPELCTRYGVSRTVLREAVARLKADGLLDTKRGRGTLVLERSMNTPFRFKALGEDSARSIAELSELRIGVEGTAAALAAQRRTHAEVTKLKSCLDRMQAAIDSGTSGTDADLEFHRTIADATHNSHYRMFMDYLRQHFAVAIDVARSHSAKTSGLSQLAQDEHRAIYLAIEAGDPDAAELAVKRHIRAAAGRLSQQDASPALANTGRSPSP